MSAEKPEISRKQAWCKFAVLIAAELPTPREIKFHPDGTSIYIQFDTAEALAGWARHFGMQIDTLIHCPDGDWIHGASTMRTGAWHGWYVRLTAYTKGEPAAEPVDEDMAAVRAIADAAVQS